MGQYIVKLPDIGEGTTEAEIVKWHVKPGQEIREEDPLVDIMTDKATVEIPAPIAGTVVAIEGNVGEKRPVGSLLVTLDVAGAGNVAAGGPPARARRAPSLRPLRRDQQARSALQLRKNRRALTHPPLLRPVPPLPRCGRGKPRP